jgi:hypothetical protein
VLEHRPSLDFEALAELNVRACDDLLELGLAGDQRQLPEVAAVQIEEVERDEDDAGRLALEFVLQDREIGGAVGCGDHDLPVYDRRTRLDVPSVLGDFLEAAGPVVSAPGEDLDRLVGEMV